MLKISILVIYSYIFLFSGDFKRDYSKEIVIHYPSQTMWQDNKKVIEIIKSQPDSIIFCKNLTLGGYSDWRVPTINEYSLIVDKRKKPNYINIQFKHKNNKGYWAEKVHWRTFWFYADYMHFVSGTPYFDNKMKLKYIRCIRDK